MADIVNQIKDTALKVKENVERVIVGKGEAVELAIVALLCEGHILIEDVPGLARRSWQSRWRGLLGAASGVFNALPTFCLQILPAPMSTISGQPILNSARGQ